MPAQRPRHRAAALALAGALTGACSSDIAPSAPPKAGKAKKGDAVVTLVSTSAEESGASVDLQATVPAGGAAIWTDPLLPGFALEIPAGAVAAETVVTLRYERLPPVLSLAAVPADAPLAALILTLPTELAEFLARTPDAETRFNEVLVTPFGQTPAVRLLLSQWGALRVRIPPKIATPDASALGFLDEDTATGAVGGELQLARAPDDSGNIAYRVYWGKSATEKLPGQAAVADVLKTDLERLTAKIPSGTAIPAGATHLLAAAVTVEGEKSTFAAAAVTDLVAARAGHTARRTFRIAGDLGTSPKCQADSVALTVGARTGGWYAVTGLAPATSYDIVCEGAGRFARVTARTFGLVTEVIVPDATFTQGGKSYTVASCFNDMRRFGINPVTGSLDVWGQSAGDVSNAPNSCFATYDGAAWHVVRLPLPDESPGAVIDYNAGTGLAYLPDGTTATRDTVRVGGNYFNRVNFCSTDCGQKQSWTSVVLDGALSDVNPCQAALAFDPGRAALVLTNGCGTADYVECKVAQDCRQRASWSDNTRLQASVGNGVNGQAFIDPKGGLWFTIASFPYNLAHCPAGADCKLLASWRQGKLPGLTFGMTAPHYHMNGTKLQILDSQDFTTGANAWIAAECDTATLDCGAIDGNEEFAAFTVLMPTVDEHAGRLKHFLKVPGGYQHTFLDSNDAYKLKWSRCTGNLATCFAGVAGWSAPALLGDGQDNVWGNYLERGQSVDAAGDPLTWVAGAAGFVYHRPPSSSSDTSSSP